MNVATQSKQTVETEDRMCQLQFAVPLSIKNQIKIESVVRGVNMPEVVRSIVEEYYGSKESVS